MTTHQVEMENFITGDLTQDHQVSDFGKDNINCTQHKSHRLFLIDE